MSTPSLHRLIEKKQAREKFAVLTAYDATFAHVASSAGVDLILVGDSLGMVLQGESSTLPVTVDDMAYHTRAVAMGNQGSLIVSDLPFMSYSNTQQAEESAAKLMRAGAHIVKLEGGAWLTDTISALSRQGVPVCAHLGLTPQSVNKLGGYKVQGRDNHAATLMLEDAQRLQDAGADMLVLECVPTLLACEITKNLDIPVIGIGAGNLTDAQVLVMHDLLGITPGRRPKFVKNFMEGAGSIQEAIEQYVADVKSGTFPGPEHSFE
ncbi:MULTISPECIES: 3-methyl-2-oxobutanoate hydroxymethyltransferase [unclassified Marinobacterium]|uniref:3-methyl-2-oxobutanoate hydroxymethyltransferase n=1 Tax=unclassified Marinobacterium TaxID=2644139 RepID=UPI0015687B81|nr:MULTISPECIES: 3-methyl-2-oxobutanoate hydroxymethyltransferase [unclassified Marinobacterium]NRP09177.1 3-methyl-2-oxobutanoate hydroxymethyltransferase [Marinobacterium sp. xm-g-48]NRP82292.1 3-methyl-2-oxobutanoate hydroxymethyltransferase [Marinobacterium sp. xm-d-509]